MQTLARRQRVQLPTSSGSGSPNAVIIALVLRHWRTGTTRNARDQRTPGFSMPFRECAQNGGFSS